MQKRSHYPQIPLQEYAKISVKLWLASSVALFYLGWGGQVRSQIAPDGTLSTNVTTKDNLNFTINDGNRAGNNLFHSFQEFSVPTGGEAFFNNAIDIQNIFSRVTGNSISNIDGLIRANGTANLFLINPNGIIFGQNAKLNIGGSFLGSTANIIKFSDGIEFSATNPLTSPLLSINLPIGLQFGNNAGEIRVRGRGQEFGLNGTTTNFDNSLNPLEVNPGNTLALIGGNIIIDGGILQVPGGDVELGAVAEGTIGLNPDASLNFSNNLARADISITNKAGINVLAATGGNISITAKNIAISADSLIDTGIATGNNSSQIITGIISLNATENTTITSSRIGNNVNINASGNSGNINITTGSLFLSNGAQLNASTYGKGNAGIVTINARDTVALDGVGSNGLPTAAGSRVELGAIGQGGSINITTRSLKLTNGAVLGASTLARGNAGTVTINASDTIFLDGLGSNGLPSAIGSTVELEAIGKAGDINITTGSLSLTNVAQLNTSTLGQGNAGIVTINALDSISLDGLGRIVSFVQPGAVGKGGSINITTGSLSLTNGGLIAASTFGQGDAGTITINARDRVSLDGIGSNGIPSAAGSRVELSGVGEGGSINISTGSLSLTNGAVLGASTLGKGNGGRVTIFARDSVSLDGVDSNGLASAVGGTVESTAVGNGGSVNITTGTLSISNLAQLTVNSKGNGAAGNIAIIADNLRLNNQGNLTAQSVTGTGGNIQLQTRNILLRNESTMSAVSAPGSAEGNIDINTETLILLAGSQIRTDALAPQGGSNIRINPVNSLGLAVFQSQNSVISASGNTTVTGNIQPQASQTPQVEVVDATSLVTQSCRSREENQFIVTGRGGLPPNPIDGISGEATWFDLRPSLVSETGKMGELPITNSLLPITNSPIVEAQGWVVNSSGKMELVASASTAIPHNAGISQPHCYAP